MPASALQEAFAPFGGGSSFQNAALGPTTDGAGQLPAARRAVVSGCEGKGYIPVSLVFGAVVAIISKQALRALWANRPRRKDCGWWELWYSKARNLHILLSAQGHPVGQRGARTGVATDMFVGRFSMMPNKRPSRTAARDESAAPEVSTPRRITGSGQVASLRLRHPTPGCRRTVAVLAYAQSRNRRGHGGGPRVGRGEEELEFVWYTEVRMPERARAALELMHVAVARYGGAGQPP